MKSIIDSSDFSEFLEDEKAILLFHVTWSQYSTISKSMIEMVERYVHLKDDSIHFYYCSFEGETLSMADKLMELGVSRHAFSGNGSVSFFKNGELIGFIYSVVGEGNYLVWKLISESYNIEVEHSD